MIGEQEYLGDAFAVADVFVLPSDVEGDSLALKEALASGLPVIATDAGSSAEMVETYGDILTIIPRRPEPEELAAAILKLTQSPQAFDPARTVAFNNFGIGHIARRWEDLLQMVAYDGRRKILDVQQANLINRLQATPVKMFKSPRELFKKGNGDEISDS